MTVIKINSEKYIQLFTEWPHSDFVFSGWDYDVKYYLFGLIAVVIYTKPLIK